MHKFSWTISSFFKFCKKHKFPSVFLLLFQGNLGTLYITNVRVAWQCKLNDNFNVSKTRAWVYTGNPAPKQLSDINLSSHSAIQQFELVAWTYTMSTSREVPMMTKRSHFEKSLSWSEWNRCGRSSPKNTMSGFTTPCCDNTPLIPLSQRSHLHCNTCTCTWVSGHRISPPVHSNAGGESKAPHIIERHNGEGSKPT